MGRICQEVGSKMFLLSLSSIQQMPNPFQTSPDWLKAKATSTAQPEDPLSRVPQEYHEFHNVFSGEKANVLAPHWQYNLKINLEEHTKPFHALIYFLSPPELTVLREFLEEMPGMVSSTPASLCGVPQYYSLRKRMAASAYVLTSPP